MNAEAEAIVRNLRLAPHREGGFYRETFRAALEIQSPVHSGARSASTAIYFLLPAGSFSAFHRVRASDEVWHFYQGDPLELHLLDTAGVRSIRLGLDFDRGEVPQAVVPAGVLQAAAPLGSRYSLCGCTVAPGFDFADFDLPTRLELLTQFPQHGMLIERFTVSVPR
jgi:predicted cupin superfamily sugar epimerase